MRLKDKVAIITGAASGIGRELALGFAVEGARVVIFDINIIGAEEVAHRISVENAREALAMKIDVTKSEEVNQGVGKTIQHFRKVDILVNNAALVKVTPFVEITEGEWNKIIEVCLKGYFFCGQAVAREMIQRRSGKIINIGSLTGHLGFAGLGAYGTSKGGIIALTRTMAVELAKYNINVNQISPGPTVTPLFYNVPPKDREARLRRIPVGRFAEPRDYLGPSIFFASEDSDYVFGQVLIVDGGFAAAGVFELYDS
jgi:NAD(P)-dependent dehydrogenase (short-subunit alcohol dehydrogenase family)